MIKELKSIKSMMILIVPLLFQFNTNVAVDSTEHKDTCKTSLIKDEANLEKFYLENGIFPASPSEGTTGKITSSGMSAYLSNKYKGYDEWTEGECSKSVSETYGGNPSEVYEYDSIIKSAKAKSNIADYNYVGCGPLALISQLNYLAEYAGYTQFMCNPESKTQRNNLYVDVFNTIKTYPDNGDIADYIKDMGFEVESGTFTFPHDFINGARQILSDYNISNGIGAEDLHRNGTYKQLISVSGDTMPSLMDFNGKINKLKASIDRGMPVIWWTTNDAGYFRNHYMNIFGYEEWIGKNEDGSSKTNLFFKLRMNQGKYEDTYMDSEALDAVNGGFIFFNEELDKTLIKPTDYSFPQRYNNVFDKDALIIGNDYIEIEWLRAGYINTAGLSGTGDWYLTMSSLKASQRMSYLSFHCMRSINFIYFDLSLWSSSEYLSSSTSYIGLEYLDENGKWNTGISFLDQSQTGRPLSKDKTNRDSFRYDFPYGTTDFRFMVDSGKDTTSTLNKGRVVIGDIGIVYSSNNTNSNDVYLSLFSYDKGNSSDFGFGHAWIGLFNNSPRKLMIGDFELPAFEGVTVGLYGNKQHKGVYYNLEHYFAVIELVKKAKTNSSSSDSSSGSSGSSSDSSTSSGSSSSAWSTGSFGVTSWILTDVIPSFIACYTNGRVSITAVISRDLVDSIADIIEAHSDGWNVFYNCSDFAIDIWNSAADYKLNRDIIQTPANLMSKIKGIDGYQTDRNLPGMIDSTGYYSNGEFVHANN